MNTLALLGQGVLLASLALPLLWLLARSENTEPASRHRRLLLVLVFSNALLFVPQLWGRVPGAGGQPAQRLRELITTTVPTPAASSFSPFSVLALVWLGVSALVLLRTAFELWRLRRAILRATPAAEADRARLLAVAQRLSLPAPRLLESVHVSVPCAASVLHPAILLPRGLRTRLTDEAFECVLTHELHHLDRRDQTWALLIALLRVPFALHPVTRRLVAAISLAREEAVDALVAKADAHSYASALLEVAAHTNTGPEFPEAVFMGAHALRKRVDMLMIPRSLRRARIVPLLTASLLLAATAVLVSPAKAATPPLSFSPMGVVHVKVGGSQVLRISGIIRSDIADPSIAESCVTDSEQLHVAGFAWGSTTLCVATTRGTFTFPVLVE